MLNIIKRVSTRNTVWKPSRPLTYIVWHYTAGTTSRPGAALNTAAYFAGPNAQGSADYIVDDRDIVQYNPDIKNRYCAAVGGKYSTRGGSLYKIATNVNCISIELCSNTTDGQVHPYNDPAWYLTNKTIANATALTVELMRQHNIPADNVIRHYDVSGKCCPGVIGWNEDSGDASKWQAVKSNIEEATMQRFNTLAEMPEWARPTVQKLMDKKVLVGSGAKKDPQGYPADLDLSLDMVKLLCINDRAGVYK